MSIVSFSQAWQKYHQSTPGAYTADVTGTNVIYTNRTINGKGFRKAVTIRPLDASSDEYISVPTDYKGMTTFEADSNLRAHLIDADGCDAAFELYYHNTVVGIVRVPTGNHGAVDVGSYGSLSFSSSGAGLVYTAELKAPSTTSLFDVSVLKNTVKPEAILGSHFERRQNFGETSTSVCAGIFYLDTKNVSALPVRYGASAVDVSFGHAVPLPEEKPETVPSVVAVGWAAKNGHKLGRVACNNRESNLYILTGEKAVKINRAVDVAVESPVLRTLSSTSVQITYLARTVNETQMHRAPVALVSVYLARNEKGDWEVQGEPTELYGEYDTHAHTANPSTPVEQQLPGGLAAQTFAPPRSALFGGRVRVMNIIIGALEKVALFDLDTKKPLLHLDQQIREIPFKYQSKYLNPELVSYSFTTTDDETTVIVHRSAPNQPIEIAPITFKLEAGEISIAKVHNVHIATCPPSRSPLYTTVGDDIRSLFAYWSTEGRDFVICPSPTTPRPAFSSPTDLLPLLTHIHGGPHSSTTSSFPSLLSLAATSILTYSAVVCVNFTGSLGFPLAEMKLLPGRCAELDVKDCVDATNKVINSPLPAEVASIAAGVDGNRVGVSGGSHGGFLSLHLIGQHPELFKAATVRNPVTNILSMLSTTDIPDWVAVEGGISPADLSVLCGFDVKKNAWIQNEEEYRKVISASPIIHVPKVKAALLLGLGLKDRRVPPQQGFEYFRALTHNSPVETHKMVCFSEGEHGLGDGEAVAEWAPLALEWVLTHVVGVKPEQEKKVVTTEVEQKA